MHTSNNKMATENVLSSMCTYLPHFPPSKNTKPSYARFLLSAPVTALADIAPHAKEPAEFHVSKTCRVRVQVGNSNRWRASSAVGSDLLGMSQAKRALLASKHDADATKLIRTGDITAHLQHKTNESHRHRYSDKLAQMRDGLRSEPAHSVFERHIPENMRATRCKTTLDSTSRFKNAKKQLRIQDEPLSLRHLNQINHNHQYVPPDKRRPTPVEIFMRNVQLASKHSGVDLILYAVNTSWNLHLRYAEASDLLCNLINEKESNKKEAQEISVDSFHDEFFVTAENQGVTVSIPSIKIRSYPDSVPVFLELDVDDSLITRHAFASALCFLYDENYEFESSDVINILAAAHFLQFESLKKRCAEIMTDIIDASNACAFHSAAIKYELTAVEEHCEKWLELNVVSELSTQMHLNHLTFTMLEKLLKSPNLFVCSEYSLYKLLCNWTFLKRYPTLEALPPWGTVVTWFMSIPIKMSFLDYDEGRPYRPLFKALRFNGITDPFQLDEISKMNIVPINWLLKVFSQHYYSLQGGGDMSLMTRFDDGAIRTGFVFKEPNLCHTEVLSLHGFHFDLNAEVNEDGHCLIYMKRLKPTESVIAQRISDRQTFSVRHDREVRYAIRAQYYDGEQFIVETTGPKCQSFGLKIKTEKSESLKIEHPVLPIYVTFSLLFPPS